MRRSWRVHGLRIAAFGVLGIAVAGGVTMTLWNSLMPPIFGLPGLSFWQALGLLLLGRLFFGGFGGRGRRPRFAHSMTSEERERFREAMRQRCGGASPEPRA
jgi:hypothetical protein